MPEAPHTFYATKGKRAFDVAVSVILLVVTAPIHILCAVAIVADDGRPVFFHQSRVGKDGKAFRLHKLRTMKVGTETVSGNYPTPDMVTKVGQALRRVSLDELPQLANILAGEMSFVGPRPALPSQVARYTEHQRGRLVIRPGLTGLAQIRHRTTAPWSQRITTDLEYIRALSLKMDLGILLRTLPAVLNDEGQLPWQTAADIDDLGDPDPHSRPSQ